MKITIIQTVIVIEDDNKPQPKRQPPVNPFLELINQLQSEMSHGRNVRRIREDEHGSHVPQ